MLKIDFRFTLILMKEILGLLEPADAALQGRSTSLKDAFEIITCVKNKIQLLRSSEKCLNILNESQNLVPYADVKSNAEKRKRQSTHSLNAFFVMETLPNTQEETEDCSLQYKSLYFEAIDLTLLQLEEMFSDNDDLLMAISSIEEFDLIKLQPLKELGIELPSIEEFSVVKDFVTMEQKESIFSKLYKHRKAFRATYQLFATIATFG